MNEFWHGLIANLAIVAAFIASWALAQDWLLQHGHRFRNLALGLFMGVAAISSMSMAVTAQPGVIFDLRAAPLAVAGLFGGPLAGIIAAACAALFRLFLGGSGAVPGIASIVVTTAIGVGGYLVLSGRRVKPIHVLLVAVGVFLGQIVAIILASGGTILPPVPTTLSTFLATLGAGYAVYRGQRLAAERDLLRMALRQAPDYHYVKDVDSRFAEVNMAVARHNGLAYPRQMVGMTDFDLPLNAPERARQLFEVEQRIMRTGEPLLDFEESITGEDGIERWFSTSKVPLFDADGRTVGLAGVTRDVTEQRRTEAELVDSKNLLTYAVEGMSDGLAMFDRTGRLVYCNDRYSSMFPLTAPYRVPGAHIRDILRKVVETGEQLDLGDPEVWIEGIVGDFNTGGEEQVALFDGRWLHIRTRPTEHGAAMVVVSDMTTLKKAEGELRSLTTELKVLAETDGLTGVMNRRSFDVRLEQELARGQSEQQPVSLIIFDVDEFKAYNDTLGHPAGDECLKIVARCIRMSLQREEDVVARYGGEEFAVILPNTDEDAAFVVADQARTMLVNLRVPHPGSRLKLVTMSAGISTLTSSYGLGNSSLLLARADQALYRAKAAGRNRVMGWRRTDVMATG
jgi:diguanylate cyclase (GGDEF)-like protein/PAS domain S-box-containing protein